MSLVAPRYPQIHFTTADHFLMPQTVLFLGAICVTVSILASRIVVGHLLTVPEECNISDAYSAYRSWR